MSLTKKPLSVAAIETVVRNAFGESSTVDDCVELTGGTFNTAYALTLRGSAGSDHGVPRRLVLKVAPPPGQPLLTYEFDLMHAEVEFHRRAAAVGVPVADVVHADLSRAVLDRDHVFLSELPGTSLRALRSTLAPADDAAVRRRLGAIAARLHTVPGEYFGYPRRDGRTRAGDWRTSFLSIVDDILADARRFGVALPASPARVGALIHSRGDVLDAVRRPVLVHFDIWDGNVFVDPEGPSGAAHPSHPAGPSVTGIIDGERCFYGDPLAEFVSLALLRDVEEVPDVLAGYARATGRPVALDASARLRLAMYTTYLYLIMLVEVPTRGDLGEHHERLLDRVAGLLDAQLSRL